VTDEPSNDIEKRFTRITSIPGRHGPLAIDIDDMRVTGVTGVQLLNYSSFRGKAAEFGVYLPPDVTKERWEALVKLRLSDM
jgi:hypothetical protein